MNHTALRKPLTLALTILLVYLLARFLLPLLLPFLLGTILALAAEPLVGLGQNRLRMPRAAASGMGVTAVLLLLGLLLALAGRLLLRELLALSRALPDLAAAANAGITSLSDGLVSLADRAPEGLRPLLLRLALDISGVGSGILQELGRQIPGALSALLGFLPDGLLAAGTGVLSAFFLSTRLPAAKAWLDRVLPEDWRKILPALRRCRKALGGWLRAQLGLSFATFLLTAGGLALLRIPHCLLWALGVALVDAVPLLGTGTVLLPWSLISLFQGSPQKALGLLAVYLVCALTRSVLEPRLLGRQLGLDPLAALVSLYVGYRLWGVAGVLLCPMLAVAASELANPAPE